MSPYSQINTASPLSQADIELVTERMRNRILFDSIADLFRVAGSVLAFAFRPLSGWLARQQVHDELMSMDDRMLSDIGISRAEIPAISAGRHSARLAADQAKRVWRPEMPVAHNDSAAPRVA